MAKKNNIFLKNLQLDYATYVFFSQRRALTAMERENNNSILKEVIYKVFRKNCVKLNILRIPCVIRYIIINTISNTNLWCSVWYITYKLFSLSSMELMKVMLTTGIILETNSSIRVGM